MPSFVGYDTPTQSPFARGGLAPPFGLPEPNSPSLLPKAPTPSSGYGLGFGAYNGLEWSPGSPIILQGLEGIEDIPGARIYDTPREGDVGSFTSPDYPDKRVFTCAFAIPITGSVAAWNLLRDRVEAAVAHPKFELPMLLYDAQRVVWCRPRKATIKYDANKGRSFATPHFLVQFEAVDPRIYNANVSFAGGALGFPSGGRTYPKTYPVNYHQTGVFGAQVSSVVNRGNYAARPVVYCQGPLVNPVLTNNSEGKTLRFNLQLFASDVLVIDFDSREVILNPYTSPPGSPFRNAIVAGSRWWELPPGRPADLFASASQFDVGAQILVTWRDTWV